MNHLESHTRRISCRNNVKSIYEFQEAVKRTLYRLLERPLWSITSSKLPILVICLPLTDEGIQSKLSTIKTTSLLMVINRHVEPWPNMPMASSQHHIMTLTMRVLKHLVLSSLSVISICQQALTRHVNRNISCSHNNSLELEIIMIPITCSTVRHGKTKITTNISRSHRNFNNTRRVKSRSKKCKVATCTQHRLRRGTPLNNNKMWEAMHFKSINSNSNA